MSVRVAPTTEATASKRGRRRAGPRRRLTFPPGVRTAIALLFVVVATLGAGVIGLASYSADRELSVGTLRLSVDPFHRGALDVYVPVVDWGARFPAVRFPARVKVEVRSVDRNAVTRIAEGQSPDIKALRREAHGAVASYIRELLGVVLAGALIVGLLAAFAVRARTGPRLRLTIPVAVGTAVIGVVMLTILLPPRGKIDNPQYYAHGPEVPRALQAIEDVNTSSENLSEELDTQLVGLARLVQGPADRRPLGALPRITLASDLHNNLLAIPALQSAAARGPLFFPGDLTDRGTPIETRLVRRVVHAGHPFVFVTGNHDSDVLVHQLASEGAIVLSENGRLDAHGRPHGPVIQRIDGLRVAGYSDPFQRLARRGFEAENPKPTPEQQDAFWQWLEPIANRVDIVMVHEPGLAERAIAELRLRPRKREIVFLVGHTHVASLGNRGGVVELNGGSIGAGGTGNLNEHTDYGLARLTYVIKPHFTPLAADLVSIDPDTGSATAERRRLDESKP